MKNGITWEKLVAIGSFVGMVLALSMYIINFGEFKNQSESDWKRGDVHESKIEELTKIQIRLATLMEVQQKQLEGMERRINESNNN